MKEAEMQQNYSPGEEPVTTDDLIFQIGEKEVDVYRKQKAIRILVSKIQELYKLVEEKNSKVVNIDNIEKKRRDVLSTLSEKDQEIKELGDKYKKKEQEIEGLYNQVDKYKKNIDNIEKKRRDVLSTLSEKDQEIKDLYNQVDEYKKTVYEKDDEIKNLNDSLLEKNFEIQEKMEEERDKVRKLRRQLKTEQREY